MAGEACSNSRMAEQGAETISDFDDRHSWHLMPLPCRSAHVRPADWPGVVAACWRPGLSAAGESFPHDRPIYRGRGTRVLWVEQSQAVNGGTSNGDWSGVVAATTSSQCLLPWRPMANAGYVGAGHCRGCKALGQPSSASTRLRRPGGWGCRSMAVHLVVSTKHAGIRVLEAQWISTIAPCLGLFATGNSVTWMPM